MEKPLIDYFECPYCGEVGKVEEYIENAELITPIVNDPYQPGTGLKWDEDNQQILYGRGETNEFRCAKCRRLIENAEDIVFNDIDEFSAYLEKLKSNDIPDIFDVDTKNPDTLVRGKMRKKLEKVNPSIFERSLI